MRRTRVLIVDDTATVRGQLTRALEGDPGVEVVAVAADARAAASLCAQLRPDVVTLDLTLPHVSGLEATERIMATCPTAILVVTARGSSGANSVLDTLAAGAVDAIEKPAAANDGAWDGRFRAAIRLVAGVPVVRRTRVRNRSVSGEHAAIRSPLPRPSTSAARHIVALGASTGGAHAVSEVLRSLPRSTRATVLLCLHVGSPFAAFVAEWLHREVEIPVRLAQHGEPIPWATAGAQVLIAPPGAHLVVREGSLLLDRLLPERHGCRPSVDVLFESVARELGACAIGCLLTGMGDDGARGLRFLRDAGARTIVQDEATSTVFGMPAAAIEMNAAEWILPLPEIGPALASLVDVSSSRTMQ